MWLASNKNNSRNMRVKIFDYKSELSANNVKYGMKYPHLSGG